MMDLFAFSGAKPLSPAARGRCSVFRSFAMLFRVVEFCVVLVFLSWTYSRVPLAVRISGEYGRQLFRFLLSPLFCFVLCNAIVVTLLFKPCGFSVHCGAADDTETELYEDLIDNSRHQPEHRSEKERLCSDHDEVVFQDKEIVSEVKSHISKIDSDTDSDSGLETPKVHKRSQSEKIKWQEPPEKTGEKLRRSETEKCSDIERYRVYPKESLYYQDDMSNDELKEKIEAFIAKELRFRREESLAIVIKPIVSSEKSIFKQK